MSAKETVWESLSRQGVSRRGFLKFCAVTASTLALSPKEGALLAETLAGQPRPTVIWLSFQECTGCTESLTRSFDPTLETLLLDHLSLDYHHTLQAASGARAESARTTSMRDNYGKYVLIVDGSIPLGQNGAYSTIAGVSNLAMLKESVEGAALVIAVGTCASFGGLPMAEPNPTGAVGVRELMTRGQITSKPLINVSGCPPVPEVISGVIAYYLVYGALPALDAQGRPSVYYANTVHDCCTRLPHYQAGRFAQSFDDAGARLGYCLFLLGCKGPTTHNACSTVKWNGGTSYPMNSGHGCLGCAEPNFWDKGGFYNMLATVPTPSGGSCTAPAQPPL